ncbi:hypothetical protein GGR57DRAFT_484047 [Xylariaceae sp. FL1272]|nr:hypothetical protein GGR57DRAFT_484047 [Xylariaceae sp. FL1272]
MSTLVMMPIDRQVRPEFDSDLTRYQGASHLTSQQEKSTCIDLNGEQPSVPCRVVIDLTQDGDTSLDTADASILNAPRVGHHSNPLARPAVSRSPKCMYCLQQIRTRLYRYTYCDHTFCLDCHEMTKLAEPWQGLACLICEVSYCKEDFCFGECVRVHLVDEHGAVAKHYNTESEMFPSD